MSATHIEDRGEASLLAEVVVCLGLLDLLLEQVWVDQLNALIVRHCYGGNQACIHALRRSEARAASWVVHLSC